MHRTSRVSIFHHHGLPTQLQVSYIVQFIPGGARRMAALMVIEYLLRLHRLAPFSVPPLVLPAYVEGHLPELRRRFSAILKSIRNSNVRDWLRRRLRVRKGRPDRWVDKVNSKKGVPVISSSTGNFQTRKRLAVHVRLAHFVQ